MKKEECPGKMRPVKDALEVLSGKWTLPILVSLMFGTRRFKQISKDVDGITDRMLSKELKEMETNQLLERKVIDTFPPRVEYSITEHGKSLGDVIMELHKWGLLHRQKIIGK
jgi:DNA-binding HxlR family transcriptional regulator